MNSKETVSTYVMSAEEIMRRTNFTTDKPIPVIKDLNNGIVGIFLEGIRIGSITSFLYQLNANEPIILASYPDAEYEFDGTPEEICELLSTLQQYDYDWELLDDNVRISRDG